MEDQDNELLTLEVLHRYVELLDKYFGNVSSVFVQVVNDQLIGHNLFFVVGPTQTHRCFRDICSG